MVTEEALPTYQSMVNRFESARDVTGADGTAWARWICRWSAEENHHDDVLNRYMYLSGRLDMRQVERTVHRLISSGMAMHALLFSRQNLQLTIGCSSQIFAAPPARIGFTYIVSNTASSG
ncbi:hypothetical protein OsJ_12512 [Oryza sativa Japonica Group]|uniref:Acyl-[acyl-carrier-protein] desaturase n=1 Tax=Oryza sativa subsp. japonica TaxID=39947 RepID=A3AMJ2_ORYSJ|nr:hypothetical protein OsJ_12512 [Oryza sativa Japonica Group]